MQKTVIIVAGGQGKRFGVGLPKQFVELRQRPIMMHTIELFHRYDREIQIIVGIREKLKGHWKSLCQDHQFGIPHILSPGGATRYQTVRNALPQVQKGSLVAIHDAVRPLLYKRTVEACFDAAARHGAALPCTEIPDSIREIIPGGSRQVKRDSFLLVQTPQVFQYELLIKAYRQEFSEDFTDDASVVEKAGFPVTVVEGNPENQKITTPQDLVYAEAVFDAWEKNSGFFN